MKLDGRAIPNLRAPLGGALTDQGRVDVRALARALDITLPTLARALGKSPNFLNAYPIAPSIQPRALQLVDRVNAIAGEVGGLNPAIAWLKTPTPELGHRSVMDVLESSFENAMCFIDRWLAMNPD